MAHEPLNQDRRSNPKGKRRWITCHDPALTAARLDYLSVLTLSSPWKSLAPFHFNLAHKVRCSSTLT